MTINAPEVRFDETSATEDRRNARRALQNIRNNLAREKTLAEKIRDWLNSPAW